VIDKLSYPQAFPFKKREQPYNLQKWKEMALKIRFALRRYRNISRDNIIESLISKWDKKEQEHFKRWLEYNRRYKKGSAMVNVKKAYDLFGQQEEKLREIKNKIRSRINSIERLLTNLADEGLIDNQKLLYIGRVLQKLKEEVNLLQHPRMLEACNKKAQHLLKKAGFMEGATMLECSLSQYIVKTAQDTKAQVLKLALQSIKQELDVFNYAYHLRKLMTIANQLDSIGRYAEASDVVEIIKKDLDGLDSIHKHLSEVYITLSKIPSKTFQAQPQSVKKI